jgi:1-acyl-sn-glycerol-3-phosphate acyltransferase
MLSLLLSCLTYITMPFRFILFMLMMIISIHVLQPLTNESNIICGILWFAKIFMYILSFNINISKEDLVKYMEYLYSDTKFICTFNHTTLIDGFVLISTFPRSSYLILKVIIYSTIGYTEKIHNQLGNIFVEKGTTSKKIKERVDSRKSGDKILFIAPGSGNTSTIPGSITEFTSNGAFVHKYPILPIVVKYEDESLNYNHDNGESMLHSCLKLFLVKDYAINIKVCDMVEYKEGETIEEYKNRVYEIMNETYKAM